MKVLRSFIAAVILVILAGCQQPVVDVPKVATPNVHVMNSKWYVVKEATVARSLQSLAVLQEEIDAYNAAHTDDQLFLVEGEEPPPIELSPNADMWMVNPITYEVVDQSLDIPRELVRQYWTEWKAGVALQGNILFIDRVPPAPLPPPPPPTDYELYAIYIFDDTGALYLETHCEDWEAAGATSRAQWYWFRWTAWESQLYSQPGWTMIKGQLWTPPVVEPPPIVTP